MENAQCTMTSNNEEAVEAVKKVRAMKRKANDDGEKKEKERKKERKKKERERIKEREKKREKKRKRL